MILRILGFFSSSFSRKIHHPRLLSPPKITGLLISLQSCPPPPWQKFGTLNSKCCLRSWMLHSLATPDMKKNIHSIHSSKLTWPARESTIWTVFIRKDGNFYHCVRLPEGRCWLYVLFYIPVMTRHLNDVLDLNLSGLVLMIAVLFFPPKTNKKNIGLLYISWLAGLTQQT